MRKKDLIQVIITAVLIMVLAFVWANASKKLQRRHLQNSGGVLPQVTVSSATLVSQADGQNNNLYNLLELQSKSIELKRDPFTAAPIISEKSLHSEIALTGILWDKEKPLAIIDGNVVKKGQRVGNKTIMDIKQDRVILSDGQVLSEIRLEH